MTVIRPWRHTNRFHSEAREQTLWGRLPGAVTSALGLRRELRTSRICEPYGSYVFDLWSDTSAMADPRNLTVVALNEAGLVVGICLMLPAKRHVHLKAFCVEPAWRGRGLAGELLDAALGLAARKWGRLPVRLSATPEGRRLYARHGFEVAGDAEGEEVVEMVRSPAAQGHHRRGARHGTAARPR